MLLMSHCSISLNSVTCLKGQLQHHSYFVQIASILKEGRSVQFKGTFSITAVIGVVCYLDMFSEWVYLGLVDTPQ